MICDWAMLCHDIEPYKQSGGLSIIGVFTRLLVDRLPGTVNPLQLAVRLSGAKDETGTCAIAVLDPDGNTLKKMPDEKIHLRYGVADFSAPLAPLSIKKIGMHVVTIAVDGIEVKRVLMPVEIVHVT